MLLLPTVKVVLVCCEMGHHCCSKQKVKRGLWSPEEDEKLAKYITTHGHGCWSSVPKNAGLQRCGKSCRLRWINYLRPDLKRGSFSAQEERIIIDVHRILGNRWAQIAKHLPGRTDNEVKNFWNSCIKKKLMAQGLDPKTHNLLPSHSKINACNPPRNQKELNNSTFTVNTHLKMGEPMRGADHVTMDIAPHIVTMPPPPPPPPQTSPHETMGMLTSFQYEDNTRNGDTSSALLWSGIKDQNLQYSSVETAASISSSFSSLGFGFMEENCPWGGNMEAMEGPKNELVHGRQQQQSEQAKMFSKNVQHEMESSSSIDRSNFDLEFMESALMPSGMYCNVTSMDQLAWDC